MLFDQNITQDEEWYLGKVREAIRAGGLFAELMKAEIQNIYSVYQQCTFPTKAEKPAGKKPTGTIRPPENLLQFDKTKRRKSL